MNGGSLSRWVQLYSGRKYFYVVVPVAVLPTLDNLLLENCPPANFLHCLLHLVLLISGICRCVVCVVFPPAHCCSPVFFQCCMCVLHIFHVRVVSPSGVISNPLPISARMRTFF